MANSAIAQSRTAISSAISSAASFKRLASALWPPLINLKRKASIVVRAVLNSALASDNSLIVNIGLFSYKIAMAIFMVAVASEVN